MDRFYLDHNADAPILDVAWAAYEQGTSFIGNPSSSHAFGVDAASALDEAAHALRQHLDADGYDVVWTSGGTEADALVLQGTGLKDIWIGSAEHAAVTDNAVAPRLIPIGTDGVYRYQPPSGGRAGPSLVCLSLANSETGVIQPIESLVRVLRSEGPVWVHCDGVQAVGRLELSLKQLDVDSFALAAHKFGGVPGIGALLLKKKRKLSPTLVGGGQQLGIRPGTLQVAGPMAMIAALEAWTDEKRSSLKQTRDVFEREALKISGLSVVGGNGERIPNTSALHVADCSGDALLMALDIERISVSTGSACSSGAIEPSKTLLAMGMTVEKARQVIRVSFGWEHSVEVVEEIVRALKVVVERARLFR